MTSELKKQLNSSKIEKITFVPFIPADNAVGLSPDADSEALMMNKDNFKRLLLQNLFQFLSQIQHNDYLQDFIRSYLLHRSKPYNYADDNATSDLLQNIDKQVYLCFLRLVSPSYEYQELPSQYPKTGLTVVNTMKIDSSTEASNKDSLAAAEIEVQFRDFLSSLELLQFPYLLDLVSILSETNSVASGKLLHSLFSMRGNQHGKEFASSLAETNKATAQLAETAIELFNTVFDKSSQKKAASKAKHFPTIQNQNEKDPSKVANNGAKTIEDQLYFVAAFMVDIVYSYFCWMKAVTSSSAADESSVDGASLLSVIFSDDGTSLSTQHGVSFIDTMKLIYDVVLPLAKRLLKHVQTNNPKNTAVAVVDDGGKSQLQTIEHYLQISQKKSLEMMDLLVAHSISAFSKATFTSSSTSTNLLASGEDSLSWLDVLQTKLDVHAVLTRLASDRRLNAEPAPSSADTNTTASGGSTAKPAWLEVPVKETTKGAVVVNESDLMLGALVSDYIHYCDVLMTLQVGNTSSSSTSSSTSSSSSVAVCSPPENKLNTLLSLIMRSEGNDGMGGVDSDRVDYILASLKCSDTLIEPPTSTATSTSVSTGGAYMSTMQQSSGASSSSRSSDNNIQQSTETAIIQSYESIKSIFPELGDGFIEACLKVYNNNTEQIVDALLMDNLHPQLSLLDRKMQRMWSGKNSVTDKSSEKYIAGSSSAASKTTTFGTASSASASGGGGGLSVLAKHAAEKEAQAHKNTLKQRAAAEEKQRQHDAYLIEKENSAALAAYEAAQNEKERSIQRERIDDSFTSAAMDRVRQLDYADDDYDDQYDDYIPSSKQAVAFKKTSSAVDASAANYSDLEGDADDNEDDSRGGYGSSAPKAISSGGVGTSSGDARNITGYSKGKAVYEKEKVVSMTSTTTAGTADATGVSISADVNRQPSAASLKRKEKKATAKATSSNGAKLYTEESRAEMLSQMADTKRFNTLLKYDEEEAAFWESMKNTNRSAPAAGGGGKDSWKRELAAAEEVELGAADSTRATGQHQHQQQKTHSTGGGGAGGRAGGGCGRGSQGSTAGRGSGSAAGQLQQQQQRKPQQQQQQGGGGGGSGGQKKGPPGDGTVGGDVNAATSTDGQKKHRTKQFDKFHQKDKANRKFGSFTPAI